MSDKDKIIETIDKVSDLVDEAISSNDYSELSRQIGKAVREATESVAKSAASFAEGIGESYSSKNQAQRKGASYKQPSSYVNEAERAWARQKYRRETEAARLRRQQSERRAAERAAKAQMDAYAQQYFARPADETGPVVETIVGGALAVIFGILMLIFTAATMAGAETLVPLIAMAVGLASGIAMVLHGRRASRKAVHFKSYRNLLLPKLYMDVKDISNKTKIPEETVVKELEEFSEKKMIKQGHFDAKKKTFIASDEIYEQYKATEKQAEILKREAEEEAKKKEAYTPEVRELLDQGTACINMIHEANADIPGEEVSEKLDRMEQIVIRIFDEVRRRPELAGSLNMFMNYYLPTTTKLIDAYRRMDQQEVQGENIRNAKREIENSLDTINDAFEKLLDSFYKEEAMDVSSDISVMKMMMKQDGLAPDDLTAMKQRQEQMKQKQAQRDAKAKPQQTAEPVKEAVKQEAPVQQPAQQTAPVEEAAPEPSLKAPWEQPIDFNAYEPGLSSSSQGQAMAAPWETSEKQS